MPNESVTNLSKAVIVPPFTEDEGCNFQKDGVQARIFICVELDFIRQIIMHFTLIKQDLTAVIGLKGR